MQPNEPHNPKSFDIKPSTPPLPQPPSEHPITKEQPAQFNSAPHVVNNNPVPQNIQQPDQAAQLKQRRREERQNMLYTILLFILAPLFAVLMILFVFQSYVVDGSSMEPTLQNGNRVFILKLPKTMAKLQNKEYTPARNEVIVFKKPTNDGTQLIKRVIGLPGDRVVIENGNVTIYNIDNPGGFNPDKGTDHENTLEPIDSDGQKVVEDVGQGELFVLGDNRGPGGSLDSHSGLGLVPIDNIIGRLWVRYFPLSEFQTFSSTFANAVLYDQTLFEKYS